MKAVVRCQALELPPLTQNYTAVCSCEAFCNRVRVFKPFKAGLTHLLNHGTKRTDVHARLHECAGNCEGWGLGAQLQGLPSRDMHAGLR